LTPHQIRLSNSQIQGRLILLAAVFVILYSIALTISPATLNRDWEVPLRWQHWIGTVIWLILFALVHRSIARRLPNADPYLLPIALVLSAWGNLTIWRLDAYFGFRQSIWAVIAVLALILGLRLPVDLAYLRRYKYVWLTSGLLLTALTIFLGTNPSGYGPRMWLGCCGVYFQPSEPLKVLLIIYLAAYLGGLPDISGQPTSLPLIQKEPANKRLLPLVAPTLLMTGLALILLLVQRDLGTAFIFLFLYAAILYVTTRDKRVLIVAGTGILISLIAGYFLFDVVQLRIEAWLNPWLDPSGRSYQIVQSLLAIANGGLFGRGPGLGAPGLVPISHSDFIFSAIVEETGWIGAIGLLLLLGFFANRGIRTALRAPDNFRRYLAAGLTTYLVAQSVLIIGGNIRLLPLTGVTLPFVSYGGSSLLTSYLSLLLLLQISDQAEEEQPYLLGRTSQYLQLASFLLLSLLIVGIGTGWWAFYRAPALLTRTDNPRRTIDDRYVQRGSILDRNNEPISASRGTPGDYSRAILYPPLSPIVGYTHPFYGQAGLETSMDEYLRGVRGNSTLSIWGNHLLYGQPPPGLDIRTTLDLNLQNRVDQAFGEHHGAAVLMNPISGEVLAMASHPGFDANSLDETWSNLVENESSPLLNRATLGRYPTGNLLNTLFPEGLVAYGLDQDIPIHLPTGAPPSPEDPQPALSPLQVALAASTLGAGGVRPAPQLVSAVNTPLAGWVLFPAQSSVIDVLSQETASSRISSLSASNPNIWETIQTASKDSVSETTWYVGGTTSNVKGIPLVLSLVLEENNPDLAAEIGRQILATQNP
jgi:cell division protein FtsW (lipid II flippase)